MSGDPIQELRRRYGFVRFWWWRTWAAVALLVFNLGGPSWAVNGLGHIGSMAGRW